MPNNRDDDLSAGNSNDMLVILICNKFLWKRQLRFHKYHKLTPVFLCVSFDSNWEQLHQGDGKVHGKTKNSSIIIKLCEDCVKKKIKLCEDWGGIQLFFPRYLDCLVFCSVIYLFISRPSKNFGPRCHAIVPKINHFWMERLFTPRGSRTPPLQKKWLPLTGQRNRPFSWIHLVSRWVPPGTSSPWIGGTTAFAASKHLRMASSRFVTMRQCGTADPPLHMWATWARDQWHKLQEAGHSPPKRPKLNVFWSKSPKIIQLGHFWRGSRNQGPVCHAE